MNSRIAVVRGLRTPSLLLQTFTQRIRGSRQSWASTDMVCAIVWERGMLNVECQMLNAAGLQFFIQHLTFNI